MDVLQQLHHFTQGEILQGKWMIGIAVIILFPIAFSLFQGNVSFQKGMAIPVCLLIAINIIYGGYILYSRTKYLTQTEIEFRSHPQQTLDAELQKAKADDQSYTTLKYVWGGCAIVFIVLYLVVVKDFYKGLSLGFAVLFLGFLVIDLFFNRRLNLYMEELNKLTI
ncbi:hypothetical protein SAMN02927921_03864 [Sinomicrobium oceani]|uniref:Uncharacterized protein n=1 Tax=Sinomicrobium oceani TaxID=1150368 RepID=A0A1K1RPH6_9FLAO|nr:hypothetical protein [Sinomicrobium oceani]SFW74171.1 hypothetical protein SAMN02927921_03864 [Sinomicrobium oceani]